AVTRSKSSPVELALKCRRRIRVHKREGRRRLARDGRRLRHDRRRGRRGGRCAADEGTAYHESGNRSSVDAGPGHVRTRTTRRPTQVLSITTTPVRTISLRRLSRRRSANAGTTHAGATAAPIAIRESANAISTITTIRPCEVDERPSVEAAAPSAASLWGGVEASRKRGDDGPWGL